MREVTITNFRTVKDFTKGGLIFKKKFPAGHRISIQNDGSNKYLIEFDQSTKIQMSFQETVELTGNIDLEETFHKMRNRLLLEEIKQEYSEHLHGKATLKKDYTFKGKGLIFKHKQVFLSGHSFDFYILNHKEIYAAFDGFHTCVLGTKDFECYVGLKNGAIKNALKEISKSNLNQNEKAAKEKLNSIQFGIFMQHAMSHNAANNFTGLD